MGKVLIGNLDTLGPDSGEGTPAADLEAHIVDPTPHPAYDDNMSLTTYFENGLA